MLGAALGTALFALPCQASANAGGQRLALKLLSTPRVGAKFKLRVSVDASHHRALGVFTNSQACPPAALDMPSQSDYSGSITVSPELRFSDTYTAGPLTPNTTLYICVYLAKIKGRVVGATVALKSLAVTTGATGPAQITRHSA